MLFEKKVVGAFKGMMYTRCDDDGTAYYFWTDDFPGLKKERYDFTSSLGHNLRGYFYFYDNPKPSRIIVFDHGFGGGHRAYMKEIELLAKQGYLVFSYDHTGCMESEGSDPRGMSQSLHDLDDCINKLKSDERFAGYGISVVGHSWGGFSTLNISALHPEISHVVVLSGYVSVKMLVDSFFAGPLSLYRKAIMKLESETNPDYVNFNGVESLKKSKAKALLIYSDNDKLCSVANYELLKAELADRPDTWFHLEHNKDHNPNYTRHAVIHLESYLKNKKRYAKVFKDINSRREFFNNVIQWDKMTEQDENVWNKILEHLEK